MIGSHADYRGDRLAYPSVLLVAVAAIAWPAPASAQSIEELRQMSIDDLASINVTSVSKTDQPLAEAPAAIFVISRQDIMRAGAVTLPEMLRLAPNLQVYQTSPAEWVVTARGLNGNRSAQNFSNKLLVLVDGRPVYTPLFSGVYWDLPDVLPDSVDRIEVISGPGATLWGANAVNGVINVITRRSLETQGFHADLDAGPGRQAGGLRYSGSIGDEVSYSLHLRGLRENAAFLPSGASAEDGWARIGGGFRIDWTPTDDDLVTFQGEMFDGQLNRPGAVREDISGQNFSVRWNRETQTAGNFQAQIFFDRIERATRPDQGMFHVETYDVEVQHDFSPAAEHHVVWGGGARLASYHIQGTENLFFDPPARDLFIGNVFVRDSFALTPEIVLTAGLKVEHLPYAGTSLLPEFRVAWKVSPKFLLWGSAARAVRSPTPFDVEVEERFGPVSLSGNPEFRTEKLTAFELGTRVQPAPTLSLSATAFYHRYDDLRTVEVFPGPNLSLGWGNNLRGNSYGIEAWADWRATSWWTLAAGATLLDHDFRFKPGASGILGAAQLGNDPPYTFTMRTSLNAHRDVTLDLDFRAVGALRQSTVPAYQELNARVAWLPTPWLTVSASGTNLLHDRHQEYPGGDQIPRRIMGGLELRF